MRPAHTAVDRESERINYDALQEQTLEVQPKMLVVGASAYSRIFVFLDRMTDDLFLHFEMIPDRLPEPLRELIAKFPAGRLSLKWGSRPSNEEVAGLIGRGRTTPSSKTTCGWLRENTGVHVHADLIVGLPGEDLDSFARGFDRLVALHPQEIQVGMLKRLRGTPIVRHDKTWEMVYDWYAPMKCARAIDDAPPWGGSNGSRDTGIWSPTAAISSKPRS